jgi:uncharacterized protein with PQ loop repeat
MDLSSLLGYLSILCWLVVFIPQLVENYRRKSSESISIHFILIWIVGDVCNLIGAMLQRLLPTVILLALYYCLSDVVLIWQILYYRAATPHAPDEEVDVNDEEEVEEALRASESVARPNHQSSIDRLRGTTNQEESIELAVAQTSRLNVLVPIVLANVAVAGWLLYLVFTHDSDRIETLKKHTLALWPQLFGWTSAILYLTARVPQILTNYKKQSCEGLSLGMFVFCVLGNVLYCASILTYSTEWSYVVVNLPWIIGSGGTLALDGVIFCQFYWYRKRGGYEAVSSEDSVY